jgi:hypothetical protein
MVLEVAMHDTKIANLVAGMWNQAQGLLERAADFLQEAKGNVPPELWKIRGSRGAE